MRHTLWRPGGVTTTQAVVCLVNQDGSLQARTLGEAGPCNVLADGIDVGTDNVLAAIRLAAEQAGLPESYVADVMVLALAGAGRQDHRDRVRHRIEPSCRVDRLHVIADFTAVLESVETKNPTVALVAGTC